MCRAISSVVRTLCAGAVLAGVALAQTPTPPVRPAPLPGSRSDPNSPAQIGRTHLTEYLDNLAAAYTSTRAESIGLIKSLADAEARQARVRKQIMSLVGTLPERTPLNPRTLGSTQADGFRIEKVLFDSQPSFPVTALLYVPDGAPADTKFPAILMSPGHSPAGKAGDYSAAALFARNGFVVLSYDPIGQGERLQYPDPAKPGSSLATGPTGEHGEASLKPMLIGDTFALYELWDAMRGIDYLAQLPEVDAKHIGAFGCSGGGSEGYLLHQTTEDVHISNCTFAGLVFACIGIGSETSGGIRNVRIEHCKFTGAKTFALYIKTRPGRGAFIEDIVANNLDVSGTQGGLIRFKLLGSGKQDESPVPGNDGIPTVSNFRFSNIRVTDAPILVDGTSVHPDKPLEGFSLVNITGTCAKGIYLANVRRAEIKNISVTGYAGALINTSNVTGIGLNGAAPTDAPKPDDPVPLPAQPYQLH
jgi:hypothetical protein